MNRTQMPTDAWLTAFRINPLPALAGAPDAALNFFVRRDLLGEEPGNSQALWALKEPQKLLKKQGGDGAWPYPGKNREVYLHTNYNLVETYRSLRVLVEQYAFDSSHPAIASAAQYVFANQRAAGDVYGILGTQYMPYYHGAILELLVKAGFGQDPRLRRGLDWLLSVRQQDGGWVVPLQQVRDRPDEIWTAEPVEPDRSQPSSHLATGMALRAFAAHPGYHAGPEVFQAAILLKSRFFKSDKYNDRRAPSYWTRFQFPFWWTSLLTGLDSLSRLGFTPADPDVRAGLDWFRQNQEEDGLWPTGYGAQNPRKDKPVRLWIGLAVCRVFKRFYPA